MHYDCHLSISLLPEKARRLREINVFSGKGGIIPACPFLQKANPRALLLFCLILTRVVYLLYILKRGVPTGLSTLVFSLEKKSITCCPQVYPRLFLRFVFLEKGVSQAFLCFVFSGKGMLMSRLSFSRKELQLPQASLRFFFSGVGKPSLCV